MKYLDKYIFIDSRMDNQYKEYFLNLEYKLLPIPVSTDVYYEVASHPDIFALKINQDLILENSIYDLYIKTKKLKFNNVNVICGSKIGYRYPEDVKLNACFLEATNKIVHNFKYSDRILELIIDKYKINKVNVKQGYANCSILVVDENSIITQDRGIYNILINQDFDVLLIDEKLDIKLLDKNNRYSSMSGFIGGAMCRLEDKIIIFGDIEKIDKNYKIRRFIDNKNLNLISFKGNEVIDYGGIVII